MQTHELRAIEVKRDMDLIRELLLAIENDPSFNGTEFVGTEDIRQLVEATGHSREEVA
jgi:hypothetical protein